jgi:transcriptional regulator of acetoin/glycerol metabolism
MDYSWPGNVRELENTLEHAFVLCTAERIDIRDLPLEIRQAAETGRFHSFRSSALPSPRLTRDRLLLLLRDCAYNKAEVARRLDISRTAVWKHMKKWDIPLRPEG